MELLRLLGKGGVQSHGDNFLDKPRRLKRIRDNPKVILNDKPNKTFPFISMNDFWPHRNLTADFSF